MARTVCTSSSATLPLSACPVKRYSTDTWAGYLISSIPRPQNPPTTPPPNTLLVHHPPFSPHTFNLYPSSSRGGSRRRQTAAGSPIEPLRTTVAEDSLSFTSALLTHPLPASRNLSALTSPGFFGAHAVVVSASSNALVYTVHSSGLSCLLVLSVATRTSQRSRQSSDISKVSLSGDISRPGVIRPPPPPSIDIIAIRPCLLNQLRQIASRIPVLSAGLSVRSGDVFTTSGAALSNSTSTFV